MPELPEVQSFVNAINTKFAGRTLSGIAFHRAGLRYPFEKAKLEEIFKSGNTLQNCRRQGKLLVLQTEKGEVQVSLGMSGAFLPTLKGSTPQKHEHLTLYFSDGAGLAYQDPRRFGFWKVGSSSTRVVDALQQKELLKFFLSAQVATTKRSVKVLLMDQNAIGGVGNIYALEALFQAKIHPLTLCSQVTKEQWRELSRALPMLLEKAIALGGSSISTYRNLQGEEGGFQKLHLVYGKEGERCTRTSCRGIVERIKQNGRSSFFCAKCQREP